MRADHFEICPVCGESVHTENGVLDSVCMHPMCPFDNPINEEDLDFYERYGHLEEREEELNDRLHQHYDEYEELEYSEDE